MEIEMNTNIDSLVEIINNNEVVTSSRQVAKLFGKEHSHVIVAINNKIKLAENCNELLSEYSKMFILGSYKDASGKQNKMYYLTKCGFMFIAFGFTGKKANMLKLEYIKAFDEMEHKLNMDYYSKIINKVKDIKDDTRYYQVYLINEVGTDNYKIGVSSDVESRLSQLQVANSTKLSIYTVSEPLDRSIAYYVENKLHKLLNTNQIVSEWFTLSKKDIELIKLIFNVANGLDI